MLISESKRKSKRKVRLVTRSCSIF